MRTIVYQSYRTHDVPDWIKVCMGSVNEWAEYLGFEYRFIDDELFENAPDWYRKKVKDQIHIVSDLARLKLAQKFLNEGYEKTIWVDADVLIFDAGRFKIDTDHPFAFCGEINLFQSNGEIRISKRVNNAITIFEEQNDLLDFYTMACQQIVRNSKELFNDSVGTRFLTDLIGHLKTPLIRSVGLFSPIMLKSIQQDRTEILQAYMNAFKHNMLAANLCGTYRNKVVNGTKIDDSDYEKVVKKLLDTKGEVFNQFYSASSQ